jgi:ADP-ribose pyrophosphatase YjhB (NUDIX family)
MPSEPRPEPPGKEEALTEAHLLRWAESLAGIARTGLSFSDSVYERERYEEVLHIAADIRRAAGRAHDPEIVVEEWLAQVADGVAGYATPKIAVGAVVGNDEGQILLIQRADSGIWLYPTGWADIGYSASEVAVKEVREETGIEVEVRGLIGLFDGLRLGFGPTPMYSVVFHCHAIGGELRPHPLEVLDVGWFDPGELPEPLARAQHWGEHALAAIRGEQVGVMYDPPRDEVWQKGPDDD